MFTIDEGTLALTAGTATYTMPVDTIDLIEHQLRTGTGTNQVDSALERLSVSFMQISLIRTHKVGQVRFLLRG